MICESFKVLLSEFGHEVGTLNQPKVAKQILDSNSFDVAIVDIYMPDVDGLETIRMVRDNFPNIKIIAMSGKKRDPFSPLVAAEAYGAKFTLEKPASAQQVIEMVEQALSA